MNVRLAVRWYWLALTTCPGSKKLESDFTATRLRVLQLEAALKGRDKELEKAGRAAESLKAELHEVGRGGSR